jgi:hypothetical protein
MKKISIEVKDGTRAKLTEEITVNHLSDLGDGVKEVIEDFVEHNEGVVLPPISIKAVEQQPSEKRE